MSAGAPVDWSAPPRPPTRFALAQLTCHRPHYFRQVLESLARCVGVSRWTLVVSAEPGNAECVRLARTFTACPVLLHLNPTRYGHTRNFQAAFQRAFDSGVDYACLSEEDALLAPDFLRWHEFAAARFHDDPSVFLTAGGHYSFKGTYPAHLLPCYNRQPAFMNKGWGTWRDRWFEPCGMHEHWEQHELIHGNGRVEHRYTEDGYEGFIERRHMRGRFQVYPVVTRVRDIGVDGVHCNPHVYQHVVRIIDWAGDPRFGDTSSIDYVDEGASPSLLISNWSGHYVCRLPPWDVPPLVTPVTPLDAETCASIDAARIASTVDAGAPTPPT